MNTSKPIITDPYEFSIKQEQAVLTRLEDLPENRKRWPTNNDLRAVLSQFNGPVWLQVPTLGGSYTLHLNKWALLRELQVTGHLPCDFAIFSVNTIKPSIILTNFDPVKFTPIRKDHTTTT